MASATSPDGAALDPRSIFDSLKDRKIVAVLRLSNLGQGTRLSFLRYLDDKFVNSKSAVLKKTAKYFYFEFDAEAGKNFTPGNYRLRLYVNQHPAYEITYRVT